MLTAQTAWASAGWYRLAVGCYIVIVIGWFAGVIAAFRTAIYAFAHKAEMKIIEVANEVFHTTPQEVLTLTAHSQMYYIFNITRSHRSVRVL